MNRRQEIVRRLLADRPMAHRVMFKGRHPDATPDFQVHMQTDFHSTLPHVLDMVFRGGGKSTTAEEALLLMALFREFKNGIIVGSSKDRANERLHAIRHEAETNDDLRRVFGDMVGSVWADNELVFANGQRILAMGKGQSLRGIKFEDTRPDLVFIDDLEERVDVSTPEGRDKAFKWLTLDLLPACDPRYRVRVAATPLHPESIPMRLEKDPEWVTHKYPIYYLHPETGEPTSAWPERFPIEEVLKKERSYAAMGQSSGFQQEYMCQAEDPEKKIFKNEMIRVEPRIRTWQAVYSMTDPARTTRTTSATTGRVVWSWIGHKLVVWDGIARRWMPDEIINDLFHVQENYHPVHIGFEEDGLNQWALQAIRTEMVKRGVTLPLRPMKAPPGKIDFIAGLQPFFQAREVEFAVPLPDLKQQLLGFPTGDIDAPNALAYALKMRPGAPMYDDFGGRHVSEDLAPAQGRPIWLCLGATRSLVTGVLLQVVDGAIRILGDGVREGDVSGVKDLISQAQLDAGRPVQLTAGPLHFDQWNNVGLRQVVARIPMEIRPGVPADRGRSLLRDLLQRERSSMPAVLVSSRAPWVLNAFAGGYARVLLKGGVLADYAEEGVYRVLMEAVESFLGLMELGSTDEEASDRTNAVTHDGRRYHSMLGSR